jgi:hypothetical protein
MLYAFIAMPVQIWHKHSTQDRYFDQLTASPFSAPVAYSNDLATDTASKAYIVNDQGASIDQLQTAGNNADHCNICSHHYSNYLDSNAIMPIISSPLFTTLYSFFQSSFPREEVLLFSNKGPPVTI